MADWQSDQVLAWTEREGPARPVPPPSRLAWLAVAGVVGVASVAMLTGPDLCPDHRAWVHALSAVAAIGTVVAVIGLLRGWALAPVVTIVSAACGVGIGFVDAVHDPQRGAFITVAFATVTVIATIMAVQQVLAASWDARWPRARQRCPPSTSSPRRPRPWSRSARPTGRVRRHGRRSEPERPATPATRRRSWACLA